MNYLILLLLTQYLMKYWIKTVSFINMIKPGLIIAIPSFTNSRIRPSHDLNQRRSYYVTYRESKVQHYTIIFHLFCCNLWERMSLFQRKVFKTSVILMVICLCGIATSNNEVHFTKLKTVVNVIFFFTSNGWIVWVRF